MKFARILQIFLAVVVVIVAVRLIWIYQQRYSASEAEQQQQRQREQAELAFNPDYYVVPKKLHAYDPKSARAGLVGHTVWVREGYRFTYFRYDPRRHRVNFEQPAGLLNSLQPLTIEDVIVTPPPGAGDQPQVMAVFNQDGRNYAFSIGAKHDGDYTIYADAMLFLEDPHQLYKHWPADVWQTIEQHKVKPGMNELQASFALGMGVPQPSDDPDEKVVVYPGGGNKTTITFRNGKAVAIRREPRS